MTRMTSIQERRREQLESAMGKLGRSLIWREQLDLRINQAMQRDVALVPLLGPAIELLSQIVADVSGASNQLSELHRDCERGGW